MVPKCGTGDQRGTLLESSFSLTYFNKVKNNVGVKFVMVPNGYMVPNGNTFRKGMITHSVVKLYGVKGTPRKSKFWASFHTPRQLQHSTTNETIRVQCGTK